MAGQLPMMEKEDFMIQSRTPEYKKLDERNNIEKTLIYQLAGLVRDITLEYVQ